MVRRIEFGNRASTSLRRILTFYDERNGNNKYSRKLLQRLLKQAQLYAEYPEAGSPSTRPNVRFFYVFDFVVVYRYTEDSLLITSIRSTKQKPSKLYQKHQ